MTKKALLVHCPICKTLVPREDENFPFCSPRCKTIDLGNWASDAYAISDNQTMMIATIQIHQSSINLQHA